MILVLGVPKNIPLSHKNGPLARKSNLIFGYRTIKQTTFEDCFGTPNMALLLSYEGDFDKDLFFRLTDMLLFARCCLLNYASALSNFFSEKMFSLDFSFDLSPCSLLTSLFNYPALIETTDLFD